MTQQELSDAYDNLVLGIKNLDEECYQLIQRAATCRARLIEFRDNLEKKEKNFQ